MASEAQTDGTQNDEQSKMACEGQGWLDCTGAVDREAMCDYDEEIRPSVGKMCHCCRACRHACYQET
jgi:hypothetical protein